MSFEPSRLLAELDLTPAEHRVLEAGRAQPPVDYDFARGEALLQATLSALAADPSADKPDSASLRSDRAARLAKRAFGRASGLWSKSSFKILLGLAVMGGGYLALTRSSERDLSATRETHVDVVLAPMPVQLSAAPQPVVTPLVPELKPVEVGGAARGESPRKRGVDANSPAREQDTAAPASKRAVSPASKTTASLRLPSATPNVAAQPDAESADPRAELRAIAQAKAMGERDPRAALVLLEQIRIRFAEGYFVEEREALTILALARSGQLALAREKAGTFLALYSNGPHSDRVREAVSARD
jgi:hypothetical protein